MELIPHTLKADLRTNPLALEKPPRLGWMIRSNRKNTLQAAYRIRCSYDPRFPEDDPRLLWDSEMVHSEDSQFVGYGGKIPEVQRKVYWQVRIVDNHDRVSGWSEVASWQLADPEPSARKANWIEPEFPRQEGEDRPSPFMRREFRVKKPVERALLQVSARGVYEVRLNGKKVGEDHFSPGWTSYHDHIQYQVYELEEELKQGKNALGVILGDGWYRGYMGWQGKQDFYGDTAALFLRLDIFYQDGKKESLYSDDKWKSSTGPVLSSDFQMGERYDARLEIPGWDLPGMDDSRWSGVKVSATETGTLIPSVGPPVRELQVLEPLEEIRTPKGERVFDFGQNMVGRVRFRLKGDRGSRIIIHHAEVLDSEGNFYTENLRKAKSEDIYIFKGKGTELYEPRFTFHGFRYIRISEYTGRISPEDLEGVVLSSHMESTGQFHCSDPMVNRLQENIRWGLFGNFVDVPTDCPQRDERLGWTGDAQVFAPTACFNVDAFHFYRKWLRDLEADQRDDGSVPWVVPHVVIDGGGTGWSDGFGATGWADAATVIPWTVYTSYGDVRVLEDQYKSMRAWVEYMIRESGESLIFKGSFHFGDWLSFAEYYSYKYNAPDYGYAGAHTSKELIATAYFYHSAGILRKAAGVLGKDGDARTYGQLQERLKEVFAEEFISPAGRMVSETQTAYVLALAFGILPEELREGMARKLADDVEHFGHLTTGFLGTPLICQALSDNGYADVAIKLLLNKRYPSWLYPITMGATTIWERWDGIRPDGSFQTKGMNSFNHYAYGAVGNWLYTRLAGIRSVEEAPGYKQVHIQPLFVKEFDYVHASYRSPYGEITSSWERKEGKIILKVSIPPNCRGRICQPDRDPEVLEVGSGYHEFQLKAD